ELVIAMVRDDDASRAIWLGDDGAVKGLGKDAMAIESSTLTPGWVKELAIQVQATGASFLDAPVLGSRPQAEAGQLIHLVGGETETLERARDVLSALGGAIHHVGPVGAGATLKLAANVLFGIQVAAVAEILALLAHSGCGSTSVIETLS